MRWHCYAWSGPTLPTEAECADPNSPLPGPHPRDWLVKPVAPVAAFDDGVPAARWFRDLMVARAAPGEVLLDVTIDDILHGVDVSRWVRTRDGGWLAWAVLMVDGAPNGQPSLAQGRRD